LRAVIQRVKEGRVYISSKNYLSEIGMGMVILVGIKNNDTEDDVLFVADKCTNLRIFSDVDSKMNLSLKDNNGEVLVISQFTLYGETSKGNRPSFVDAAKPEKAVPLYNKFIERMKENLGADKVKRGLFGEMMEVKIINDGPVTVIVESKNSNK
jgi:D-tyrosyl-tRNA(Tyr) deacylase